MSAALVHCFGTTNYIGHANFWRESAEFWARQIIVWEGIIKQHEEAKMDTKSCWQELRGAQERMVRAEGTAALYAALALGL